MNSAVQEALFIGCFSIKSSQRAVHLLYCILFVVEKRFWFYNLGHSQVRIPNAIPSMKMWNLITKTILKLENIEQWIFFCISQGNMIAEIYNFLVRNSYFKSSRWNWQFLLFNLSTRVLLGSENSGSHRYAHVTSFISVFCMIITGIHFLQLNSGEYKNFYWPHKISSVNQYFPLNL